MGKGTFNKLSVAAVLFRGQLASLPNSKHSHIRNARRKPLLGGRAGITLCLLTPAVDKTRPSAMKREGSVTGMCRLREEKDAEPRER